MSIEKDLVAGEKILVKVRPHVKALLRPVLVLLLIVAAVSFFIGFVYHVDSLANTIKFRISLGLVILGLIVVFVVSFIPWITWITTRFVITDKRFMYRKGIISRVGVDIPYARVASVEYHQGLIDRLLSAGSLIIESSSEDPVLFSEIPKVKHIHGIIYAELQ